MVFATPAKVASFERAVVEPDLASVDLDMELLDRALKDDLAPR